MSAVDSGIAFPLNNEAAADSSAKQERNNDGTKFTAAITVVCRSALVKSPAASRAALAKHRAFIDPSLVEILEIVGNYPEEVTSSALHTLSYLSYFYRQLSFFTLPPNWMSNFAVFFFLTVWTNTHLVVTISFLCPRAVWSHPASSFRGIWRYSDGAVTYRCWCTYRHQRYDARQDESIIEWAVERAWQEKNR